MSLCLVPLFGREYLLPDCIFLPNDKHLSAPTYLG